MIYSDSLAYQAKAFYNAYINLEQCHKEEGGVLFVSPMFVNGAFSVELSLKTILAYNNIDYGKEHNFLVLFRKLPQPLKCELLSYLFEKLPAEYHDEEKWANEFLLVSNAFIDCRYCFEGQPTPVFDRRFLAGLANASICVVLQHYNVDYVLTKTSKSNEEIEKMIDDNNKQCIERNLKLIQRKEKKS